MPCASTQRSYALTGSRYQGTLLAFLASAFSTVCTARLPVTHRVVCAHSAELYRSFRTLSKTQHHPGMMDSASVLGERSARVEWEQSAGDRAGLVSGQKEKRVGHVLV